MSHSAPLARIDSGNRDPQSKSRHIDVCLGDAVEYRKSTGLERYRFDNQALPEVSLNALDLGTTLGPLPLATPLMIAPMTGGNEQAYAINRRLAAAAERWRLAMGVGSQRIGIEDPARAKYFQIRELAPNATLFANLGGAQLVAGWGEREARAAVDMLSTDALFIHLNPVQEAIQGGDQDFRGLAARLTALCRALAADDVPVFAREVGFGISENAARRLIDCGVAGIDCSGAGGTSWAKVEALCAKTERRRVMGETFGEWGIPTAESIRNVRAASATLPLIACGGLRSGIDLAKALALGADAGAMARPFLLAADADAGAGDDADGSALDALIEATLNELKICMFGAGADTIAALRGTLRAERADV